MVGASPRFAMVNSAPLSPYVMSPAVVFHVEPADDCWKLKVALLIPSAVSLGQSVELRGLHDVQVCAAAGAAMAESSERQRRSDIVSNV